MPRKCSIDQCKSNYLTKNDRVPLYRFPKREEELNIWLHAIPNSIPRESITRNMGVCRKHWPNQTVMKLVFGREVPADPPSVFVNLELDQGETVIQTKTSNSRNIEDRKISLTDRNSIPDEMKEFNKKDIIGLNFMDFQVEIQRRASVYNTHAIIEDNIVRLVSFDDSFRETEFSVFIDSKFSLKAFRRLSQLSLTIMKDILGFQYRLIRWSQLEAILPESEEKNCCTSDFTESEWDVFDNIPNLIEKVSMNERNIIFYVAGYIVQKESVHSSTNQAYRNLLLQESEFLNLVSRGKLSIPDGEIFNFVLLCYSLYENFSHSCTKRIIRALVALHDIFLFDISKLDKVTRRLVNIFQKGFVRKINEMNLSSNQNRKKQKLNK